MIAHDAGAPFGLDERAAREAQERDRLVVDGDDATGGPVLGRRVGDGGVVGEAERVEAGVAAAVGEAGEDEDEGGDAASAGGAARRRSRVTPSVRLAR